MIQATDGNFYGTTMASGTQNGGPLFKLTPAGMETVLWNFHDVSGAGADSSLILGGTINSSGSGTINSSGTIFRVTPGGVETVLWDFGYGGNVGFSTAFGVIQGTDGNFYGTTSAKGSAYGGVLFKLVP